MFTILRISHAQNEYGLFNEGGIKESFLRGFLKRSDSSVHMGANGPVVPIRVIHKRHLFFSYSFL